MMNYGSSFDISTLPLFLSEYIVNINAGRITKKFCIEADVIKYKVFLLVYNYDLSHVYARNNFFLLLCVYREVIAGIKLYIIDEL